jgi:hypothetical protein
MFDHIGESCNVVVRAVKKDTREIVHERVGHNVWTNTGREYSCLLKTADANGSPYRQDLISYMGVGSGSQPETVNVIRVESPLAYERGTWLKPIVHTRTVFQTVSDGVRTAVRYTCTFTETEFILSPNSSVLISECGLFTNGNQDTFVSNERDRGIDRGIAQSPVAYHSFDPIPKTGNIELEIIWELRH